MTTRRLQDRPRWLGGLRRWLSRRVHGGFVGRRDSDKSRRDLLDEIYYLRDVAGERGERIATLQARVEALQRELAALRAESAHPASAESLDADEVKPIEDFPADLRDATPCLFVDVTELAVMVGQTGIQRVTREILRALLNAPPAGYRVEAVCTAPGQAYRYARAFARGLAPVAAEQGPDTLIHPRNGDVFLGLDHSMHATVEQAGALEAMRRQGVRLWFVCNDILPLSHPEWFPPDVHTAFKAWLESIVRVADGIACISHATEDELKHWLDQTQPARQPPLRLGHFHLGADIPTETTSTGFTPEQAASLESLRTLPSFLTVGTLEPRKGHAQALEAFEILWAQGENVAWVIVGLPGWMTEVVQRRIRHHDEFDRRLFWFMHASDALLEKLYASCTALLAPSEGEGFGLPLVEAARHGMPILCRDLPVFREVAGEFAMYFSGSDTTALADTIHQWLMAQRQDRVPPTVTMPRLTWTESTRWLMDTVLGGSAGARQADSARIGTP